MTLMIRPNEGAGDIVFGMTQSDVRAALGHEPKIKKSDSIVPSDFFSQHGMLVHYSDEGVVEAIEIGAPATPVFMGKPLIGVPFEGVDHWLRSMDPRLQSDAAGLTSYRFGVGVYAPQALKSPRQPVEGVIVFRPGYYG
jgi:hypothetical protein